MKYLETFTQGNHSSGRFINPIGVVLHHNYLLKDDLIKQMTESKPTISTGETINGASYHCVGWKDGTRTVFAKDNQRAWHAGASEFNGRKHCNNFMLGYSFHINSNREPLTAAQIESFIEWLIPRIEAWGIKKSDITDHRNVAPGRKVDLNPVEFKRILTAIDKLWL
jgi:AmpD protein